MDIRVLTEAKPTPPYALHLRYSAEMPTKKLSKSNLGIAILTLPRRLTAGFH